MKIQERFSDEVSLIKRLVELSNNGYTIVDYYPIEEVFWGSQFDMSGPNKPDICLTYMTLDGGSYKASTQVRFVSHVMEKIKSIMFLKEIGM